MRLVNHETFNVRSNKECSFPGSIDFITINGISNNKSQQSKASKHLQFTTY